jgi:hypothetical protein
MIFVILYFKIFFLSARQLELHPSTCFAETVFFLLSALFIPGQRKKAQGHTNRWIRAWLLPPSARQANQVRWRGVGRGRRHDRVPERRSPRDFDTEAIKKNALDTQVTKKVWLDIQATEPNFFWHRTHSVHSLLDWHRLWALTGGSRQQNDHFALNLLHSLNIF